MRQADVEIILQRAWEKLPRVAPRINSDSVQPSYLPRRLVPPKAVGHGSLTTLWETLIKIGAEVVRYETYVTFQLAEVAVPRELFAVILDRIQRFGVPPRVIQQG